MNSNMQKPPRAKTPAQTFGRTGLSNLSRGESKESDSIFKVRRATHFQKKEGSLSQREANKYGLAFKKHSSLNSRQPNRIKVSSFFDLKNK